MVTPTRRPDSRILRVLLVALFTGLTGAFAQDVASVFITPTNSFVAGSRNSLWLYSFNNSSNAVPRTFAPRLDAQLSSSLGKTHVVLELDPASASETAIPANAFAREKYFVDVPATIHGQAWLTVSNFNPVALQIDAASVATRSEVPPPAAAPTNRPPRSAIAKFFDTHLSPYEPIYFLLGTYPAAEFQFSLKYQLFDLPNDRSHVLTNLYFAYSQVSYWDLIASDPSFFDTSYKPSLFAYYPDLLHTKNNFFQLDLQGGAEHESNGRGGEMERSIYTAYLQPTVTFGRPGHLQFALRPRAWTYFWVGHNNPDIAAYRGYVDLHSYLTLKKDPNSWANFQVETRFRIGDGGRHPGIQIDGRYKFPHFNPVLQVQYFEGYGQTLRQYNKEAHGIRAGFCLWYWPDYPSSYAIK